MNIILNPIFLSVFVSVVSAQIIKTILDIITNKHFDWRSLLRGAGMPSSHTATVTSLTLAVYLIEGYTTVFLVTLILSIIVIRDVIGDKIFATHQENIMNRLIQQIIRHEKVQWNHLIGHTLVEVFFGMLLAVCVTFAVFYTLGTL